MAAFAARLRSISPTARILRSVRGDGTPKQIWGLSGLRKGVTAEDALVWATGPADPFANLSGFGTSDPAPVSPHDTRIGTASVVIDEPIPSHVFDFWLDTLIALRGPDILRIKGIAFIEDIPDPFVFHGVQQLFDPPVRLRDWPGEDRRSRIVVIACDISRPELQRSFDMLRARRPQGRSDPLQNEVSIP